MVSIKDLKVSVKPENHLRHKISKLNVFPGHRQHKVKTLFYLTRSISTPKYKDFTLPTQNYISLPSNDKKGVECQKVADTLLKWIGYLCYGDTTVSSRLSKQLWSVTWWDILSKKLQHQTV